MYGSYRVRVVRFSDTLTLPVDLPKPSTVSPSLSCLSGTPFDVDCYVDYNTFSVKHKGFLVAVTKGKEPQSFQEAVKHPGWRKAME